ncbi:MAG TPA: hypothetical protein VJR30_22770 [Bradyrhizobium sp.]|nr:hypothetical protein [Bradyrhizobium sp.]
MGDQNLPKTASEIVGPVDPRQGAQPRSTVVFLGDPAQVAEGFVIALRAMGIDQSEPGEDPDA